MYYVCYSSLLTTTTAKFTVNGRKDLANDNDDFGVDDEEEENEFFHRFLVQLCERFQASYGGSKEEERDDLLFSSVALLVEQIVDDRPGVDRGR